MKLRIMYLCFIFHTMSLMPTVMCPWYSRAVPIAYDRSTNKWNVLLGHNKNQFWSDFNKPSRRGNAPQDAQRALSEQTKGQYNVSMHGVPWRKNDQTKDIFHFVKVDFKPSDVLYSTAQGNPVIKDDFVWLPADTIMQLKFRENIRHINHSVSISESFHKFFKQVWSSIKGELEEKQPTRPTTPEIVSSWFEIPRTIKFYKSSQPYFQFTNVVGGYPIDLDGTRWPSTEHYFQAQKFKGNKSAQNQLLALRPGRAVQQKAQDLAKQHDTPADWHQRSKFEAMLTAVRAKFNQHSRLQKTLLGTGNAVIIEDAGAADAEWGAGADGKGNNHLGRMLMLIRQEIKDGKKYPYDPQSTLNLSELTKYNLDPSAALK